jgi:hypothetical protein
MPAEGQFRRQNQPLRHMGRIERRFVVIITTVMLALSAGVIVLAITSGSEKVGPGCLRLTAAGATGAISLHTCGADAIDFCRQQAARSDALAQRVHVACHKSRIAGF